MGNKVVCLSVCTALDAGSGRRARPLRGRARRPCATSVVGLAVCVYVCLSGDQNKAEWILEFLNRLLNFGIEKEEHCSIARDRDTYLAPRSAKRKHNHRKYEAKNATKPDQANFTCMLLYQEAHDGACGAVDRGHFLTSTRMGTRAHSFRKA